MKNLVKIAVIVLSIQLLPGIMLANTVYKYDEQKVTVTNIKKNSFDLQSTDSKAHCQSQMKEDKNLKQISRRGFKGRGLTKFKGLV